MQLNLKKPHTLFEPSGEINRAVWSCMFPFSENLQPCSQNRILKLGHLNLISNFRGSKSLFPAADRLSTLISSMQGHLLMPVYRIIYRCLGIPAAQCWGKPLSHMICGSIAGHRSLATKSWSSQDFGKGIKFIGNLESPLCGVYDTWLSKFVFWG